MRQQPNRSLTYRKRAEAQIDSSWPGGVSGFLAEYERRMVTLEEVTKVTGVSFRALNRIMEAHGVKPLNRGDALRVAYRLKPERIEKTREKLRTNTSFRRPEVRQKMSETKRRQYAENPSLHINSKATPTTAEHHFGGLLSAAGINPWHFSFSIPPFWVDFYLPSLRVAVEVCRRHRMALERHEKVLQSGLIDFVFYIPTWLVIPSRDAEVHEFVAWLKRGNFAPAASGGYLMFGRSRKFETVEIDGVYMNRMF